MSLIWLWTITVCVPCIEMNIKLSNEKRCRANVKWNSTYHVFHLTIVKLNNKLVGVHTSPCILYTKDVRGWCSFSSFSFSIICCVCCPMSCYVYCIVLSVFEFQFSKCGKKMLWKRKHCDMNMLKPFTIRFYKIIITDNRSQRPDRTRWK